jgi:predicted nucleic acid-binding Zn ribbon protein
MSYMVCEECGNYHEFHEGKESFSYGRCPCGGKLRYFGSLKDVPKKIPLKSINSKHCLNCGWKNSEDNEFCSNCGKELDLYKDENITLNLNKNKNPPAGIRWRAVFIGFLFLFISIIFAFWALFGTNIPQNAAAIPTKLLADFGMASSFLAIIAGILSGYLAKSRNYKDGIINGGLLGVLLGILIGFGGGILALIAGTILFGSFSLLGGVLGILIRRKV